MAPALASAAAGDVRYQVARYQNEGEKHTGYQNCVRIPVVPSCSKGKAGLDKALDEIGNGCALQGEVDGNFSKVVHDIPHQCHHSQICQGLEISVQ